MKGNARYIHVFVGQVYHFVQQGVRFVSLTLGEKKTLQQLLGYKSYEVGLILLAIRHIGLPLMSGLRDAKITRWNIKLPSSIIQCTCIYTTTYIRGVYYVHGVYAPEATKRW